ncbi:MAG: hypothetical protein RBS95_07300 [Desulfobulbus sp.]|jgi:hypothetical protein|nr:hypothetical protein [Desulfobulbus sp.]
MLTREQALNHLNLPPEATSEAIEKAYQRMVRRYPPEFHPDRFRQIDESYRTLTSLAFVVERILAAESVEPAANLTQLLADLPLLAGQDAVAASIRDLRRLLVIDTLWP